jgi:hypothetical protein
MMNMGLGVKGRAAEYRRGRKSMHSSNFKMVPQ